VPANLSVEATVSEDTIIDQIEEAQQSDSGFERRGKLLGSIQYGGESFDFRAVAQPG
jgi:hypothetical protein